MSELILALPLRTAFDKHEWRLQTTNMATAEQLVKQYHYARGGSANNIYLHGLFLGNETQCYGVAWWIPAAKGTVDKFNPGGYATTLVLHRLVIHPLVPTNGASFLLGRSIRLIAQGGRYDLLMTYADTWRGHSGVIYKATNWHYEGLSVPTPVWIDGEGRQRGTASGHFGQRKVGLNGDELRAMGCTLVGRFPKHVYSMRLTRKAKLTGQKTLWEQPA